MDIRKLKVGNDLDITVNDEKITFKVHSILDKERLIVETDKLVDISTILKVERVKRDKYGELYREKVTNNKFYRHCSYTLEDINGNIYGAVFKRKTLTGLYKFKILLPIILDENKEYIIDKRGTL